MRKKLLFIAPDYYLFNEVVFEGLKKYSDYDVTHLVSNFKSYKYRHFGERLHNFFSKTFLQK
ncbi:MAG: lipopolysaccharide core biosynthesis protein rfaS, partial [Capnocytophaga sp.]|nr:lipopolysaccharide core biosynthesis protein rfaS [Capnocytophaga sp.]